MEPRKQKVAVVVPWYKKSLGPEEQVSLAHLKRFLKGYPWRLAAPRGLGLRWEGFETTEFPPSYFTSTSAYSQLLVSEQFYAAFRNYEYLLIYQLDALVFSDSLKDWCAKEYDYIGSPWARFTWAGRVRTDCVGNGGFSLRRVESFLKVLRIYRHPEWELRRRLAFLKNFTAYKRWKRLFAGGARRLYQGESVSQVARRGARLLRDTTRDLNRGCLSEDLFWSFEAARLWEGFRVAPAEEAKRFAISAEPGIWLKRNGGNLPFGCHGWAKPDRAAFWEPHLLKVEEI